MAGLAKGLREGLGGVGVIINKQDAGHDRRGRLQTAPHDASENMASTRFLLDSLIKPRASGARTSKGRSARRQPRGFSAIGNTGGDRSYGTAAWSPLCRRRGTACGWRAQ